MDATAQTLKLYRQLEATHRQMLEVAKTDDWEEVAALGQVAEATTIELGSIERAITLSAEDREIVTALTRQTLELIEELRKLAEPARADRSAELASGTVRSRLADRYGV